MSNLEAISIVVGVASGVSGLVLGIANWWHQRVTTRPRVLVRPRVNCIIDQEDGETVATYAAVLEIRNVGHVPVVGSTVGLLRAWTVTGLLPKRMRNGRLVRFLRLRRSAYAWDLVKQEPLRKGLGGELKVPGRIFALRIAFSFRDELYRYSLV